MPPRVERQLPPKKVVEVPKGSLLADAVPVTALREDRVRVCIYGRNRSGKTTLACQFRKPLLLISAELDSNGGALSVADHDGVVLQRVSNRLLGKDAAGRWVDAEDPKCVRRDSCKGAAKVVALATELAGEHPFATVVFDTVTSLQEVILAELLNWSKVPDSMNWGSVPDGTYQMRSEKFRSTLRPLLDLNNCNLVLIAQEKDHNAEEDRGGRRKILHTLQQGSFMAPALGSTNAEWLQSACGYVVQLYDDEVTQEILVPVSNPDGTPAPPVPQRVGTGRRERHLRLLYHPNFMAGGRLTFRRDIPEFVHAPDPQGLYAAMAAYIPALR